MSHVSQTLTLHYAGLNLTVVKSQNGTDCVPLKPLADLFGLKWENQREKVNGDFYRDYLGICVLKTVHSDETCTPLMGGADDQVREHTCIRLDRVAAYLMTINPERVKANGNADGAAFLEEKLNEWADALHDYELLGLAINPNHGALQAQRIRLGEYLMRLMRQRSRSKEIAERTLLDAEISRVALEAGLPYTQPPIQPEAQQSLGI